MLQLPILIFLTHPPPLSNIFKLQQVHHECRRKVDIKISVSCLDSRGRRGLSPFSSGLPVFNSIELDNFVSNTHIFFTSLVVMVKPSVKTLGSCRMFTVHMILLSYKLHNHCPVSTKRSKRSIIHEHF